MEESMAVEYGQETVTFSFHGASWEEWYTVYRDGTVTYHGENDGWRFMRRGSESIEKTLTLEQLYATFGDARGGAMLLEAYQAISTVQHPHYHTHLCRYDPPYVGHQSPCILANCRQPEQTLCETHLRRQWERPA
jgi:hypothetical protein